MISIVGLSFVNLIFLFQLKEKLFVSLKLFLLLSIKVYKANIS